MIPRPAQYLLRFDDLCPTMDGAGWRRCAVLIGEFGLQPILAIVPDNRDPELEVAEANPDFWAEMKALEKQGATIGLHGFQHLCMSRGRGLLPLHPVTEFAGVREETQRRWIQEGMAILRRNGLNPKVWVAPRHGLDRATLRGLRGEGIELISDGLARRPFRRGGVTWIPQQLWGPVEKESGVWTICVHANTASEAEVDRLRGFLQRHRGQFTSVERVAAECGGARLGLLERSRASYALWRLLIPRGIRRWKNAHREHHGAAGQGTGR
jgi:hypothetical protein